MSSLEKLPRRMPAPIALSFGLWAVTYVVARIALESTRLSDWARLVLALTPLPFFLAALITLIGMIRGMDELERRIQLEALAVAFPLSLVLFMTLGLVEIAQPLDPQNWSHRHLWPFLVLFYVIGLAIARRRYQ